jgi:MFS family permease
MSARSIAYDGAAPHRWWLASGLFAVLMLSSGFGFYNLSAYMTQLAAERGFAVSQVSGAVGAFFLSGGVVGLLVGRILERRDVRLVLLVGATTGGLALAALGFVVSVWQLFVVYVLFGAGNACVSLIPATTLLTRWFDERSRPIALSFASTGLSVGGVVLTPLSVALLEEWPLERAMPALGFVYCAGIVAITYTLVRSWPAASPGVRPTSLESFGGTPYVVARRHRFFILLTAAYMLLMAGQVGGIAHLFARGVGVVGAFDASIAVSVLATASVVGRLIGGWLVGFVAYKPFTAFNLAGQAAGLFAVGLADDTVGLWAGAALFGVTVGNLLMLQPLMLAQSFGVADYPRIFGVSQAATTLGVAGGPTLIGLLYEQGGYGFAFGAVATLSIVALGLLWGAGPLPRPTTPSAERYPSAGGAAESAAR